MKRLAVLTFATLAGCGSGSDSTAQALEGPDPGQCGPIETHVFGVHDALFGQVEIEMNRPGQHVIIVSSHDAASWKITTGPGAEIVHVYAVGVGDQTVDVSGAAGDPDVRIDSKATTGVDACGYSWPYDGLGCNTASLLRLGSVRTGHDITSFDGCHSASNFMVDDRMHAYSDCTANFDTTTVNHFIVECNGGDEGHCGKGSGGGGSGSGSGSDSGDGGGIFY